jgi:hypothetical protein
MKNIVIFFVFIYIISVEIVYSAQRNDVKHIKIPWATPALIDGILDDWNDAVCDSLIADNSIVMMEYPENSFDAGVIFYLKHDGSNLYMGFDIYDDYVCNYSPEKRAAYHDLLRLFYNADHDDKRTERTKEGFEINFYPYGDIKIDLVSSRIDFINQTEYNITHTNEGWIVEIKIPFAFFDTKDGFGENIIKPGQTMKFNLLYTDFEPENLKKTRLCWMNGRWAKELPFWGILTLDKNKSEIYKKDIFSSPTWKLLKEFF